MEGRLTPLIILIRPAELIHDLHPELVEHLFVQFPDPVHIVRQLGDTHSERDIRWRIADHQSRQFGGEGIWRLKSAV